MSTVRHGELANAIAFAALVREGAAVRAVGTKLPGIRMPRRHYATMPPATVAERLDGASLPADSL